MARSVGSICRVFRCWETSAKGMREKTYHNAAAAMPIFRAALARDVHLLFSKLNALDAIRFLCLRFVVGAGQNLKDDPYRNDLQSNENEQDA